MIKIETTKVTLKRKRKTKYNFGEMKVGNHFWAAATTHSLLTSFKAWCSSQQKNWQAKTVSEVQKGIKGARIKRIK